MLDENRQAIGTTFITEVAKAQDGGFYNKVVKSIAERRPAPRHVQGRVREDRPRPRRPTARGKSGDGAVTPNPAADHAVRRRDRSADRACDALVTRARDPPSARCARWMACRSRWRRESGAPSSAPTGRARPHCSTWSPATSSRQPGACCFFGEDVTAAPPLPPHPTGTPANVSVLPPFPRALRRGQPVPGGARGGARALQSRAPVRLPSVPRRHSRPARPRAPHSPRRATRGVAGARAAAPARDRHGAGRSAAPHPVRRARRGAVSRGTARAGHPAHGLARPHGVRR